MPETSSPVIDARQGQVSFLAAVLVGAVIIVLVGLIGILIS